MIQIALRKQLGALSLDVDFEFPGHGITVLSGPSGAGKTTLINLIAGLLSPDAGQITVGGTVWFDSNRRINLPVQHRHCGTIFQDGRLFPHLTVRRNLLYAPQCNPARLDEITALLGIEPLLMRKPSTLSGGEKQRVSMGRALLMNPSMLLMDEPLASLDDARKQELIPYIVRLAEIKKLPVLYVTHARDEALRLGAKHLLWLESGRLMPNNHWVGRPAIQPQNAMETEFGTPTQI